MALTPCSPCECISGEIPVDKFKQDMEIILCNILDAILGEPPGEAFNLTGINEVTPAVGNGATNTGTLRVTLSNDSTGQVRVLPATTLGSGQTTVTTAGTQVALAGSTPVKSVTVKAKKTNTGLIYVGAAAVDSTTGFILSNGDSVTIDIDNLADIWIDSSINAEGVSYLYVA